MQNKDWLKNNSLIYIFKDGFRPLRVIFRHLWEHLNEKSINIFFAGDTNTMYVLKTEINAFVKKRVFTLQWSLQSLCNIGCFELFCANLSVSVKGK